MKKIYTHKNRYKILLIYILNIKKNLNEISQKYGASRIIIKRILLENNIELRKTTNTYKANRTTFESINTPEKVYWLCYFDGDGSICKCSSGDFDISIQGTKEMLEWINDILCINNNIEKRYQDNKNNYYIRCGGNKKPYYILNKLYNSCEVHLDRKYLLYKELETVVLNRNIK